jgi:steroid delta-isomerase-like uncharacterized protein
MIENRLETHRKIVKTIFDQAWNQVDFNGIADLIAEDAVFHIRKLDLPTNANDLERIVNGWHTAFRDFQFTIEDMVAERDLVAVRLRMTGTHQRKWQEIPETGKKISVTVMMFLRFKNEKVVEIWEDYDEYGMRKQLGKR